MAVFKFPRKFDKLTNIGIIWFCEIFILIHTLRYFGIKDVKVLWIYSEELTQSHYKFTVYCVNWVRSEILTIWVLGKTE